MTKHPTMLDYILICGIIALIAVGLGLAAWLYHKGADGAAVGAVTTLLASIVGQLTIAVRNRFPGPEIDVTPPQREIEK